MINAADFLNIIENDNLQASFKLGKIDPAYTTGRPKIVFDGEAAASGKTYSYLGSYMPAANDRVIMAVISETYVILGKII